MKKKVAVERIMWSSDSLQSSRENGIEGIWKVLLAHHYYRLAQINIMIKGKAQNYWIDILCERENQNKCK